MAYKKYFLALLAILFLTQRWLYATQMEDKVPDEDNDIKEELLISHRKNLSGMNFKGKKLPKDLSYANLTNACLAAHHFRYINFTGAVLSGVILTNTTCDYEQCFQDHLEESTLSSGQWLAGGQWFFDCLPKDLQRIAQVYPQLRKNEHKAKLLQIACGLAYLPCYKDREFYIKVEYWSCQLLLLKKQLGNLGVQLVCSLANDLVYEANNCCWQTNYPVHLESPKGMQIASRWSRLATQQPLPSELCTLIQYYLTEPGGELHADFDQYVKLFQEGLVKYNIKSNQKWGYNAYRNNIVCNIQGLKKVYPKLISEKLRKEAMKIAYELSQAYKKQHFLLLLSFLTCQNRLIKLKWMIKRARAERSEASLGLAVKNDIHYNYVISHCSKELD